MSVRRSECRAQQGASSEHLFDQGRSAVGEAGTVGEEGEQHADRQAPSSTASAPRWTQARKANSEQQVLGQVDLDAEQLGAVGGGDHLA
jgi:hypothetical protein